MSNLTSPSDFRPINLLLVLDKVLEAVIYKRLRNFIKKELIYEGQAGSLQSHSCESALQYLLLKLKNDINGENMATYVFWTLDREKNHQVVEKQEVVWLKDNKIKMNGAVSSVVDSDYKVPQESVFGPLLFLLYVKALIYKRLLF